MAPTPGLHGKSCITISISLIMIVTLHNSRHASSIPSSVKETDFGSSCYVHERLPKLFYDQYFNFVLFSISMVV